MLAQVGRFQLFRYFSEVRQELQKVTWPTREQTVQLTLLVIVASVIVGMYVGTLDYIFAQLTGLIVK